MTKQELFDQVLILIDEAGNTTEYQDRFITAYNTVQKEVTLYARPIKRYVKITSVSGVISLPTDLYRLLSVRDANYKPARYIRTAPDKLLLQAEPGVSIEDETFNIVYSKVPGELFPGALNGTIELDSAAFEALRYGCAALLVFDEPDLYHLYTARYQNALANLANTGDMPTTATIKGGVRL